MELKVFFTNKTNSLWKKRNEQTVHDSKKTGIEIYYYSADRIEKNEEAQIEDVNSHLPEWATNMWINVEGIDETVINKLTTTFHLHPLAIEDVVETDSKPKLDWYDHSLFMVTKIISEGPLNKRTGIFSLLSEQVSFFLMGTTLITIQEGLPGDIWQSVRQGLNSAGSQIRRGDAGFLLYALLVGIVDTCEPIMDTLEDLLQDLEIDMLERPTKKMNRLVYLIKRHLMTLRTTLLPTRKIVQKLITSITDAEHHEKHNQTHPPQAQHDKPNQNQVDLLGSPRDANQAPLEIHAVEGADVGLSRKKKQKEHHHSLSASTITYLRDLLNELSEMAEQLEHQRELANSLSGLYSEHQAQMQGDVSYAIALVSVFFLPLTFVAGVYGMNFTIMPELSWELGYLYVWMVFIGITLFEMVLFYKIGWLTFGSKIDRLLSCQKAPVARSKRMRLKVSSEDTWD